MQIIYHRRKQVVFMKQIFRCIILAILAFFIVSPIAFGGDGPWRFMHNDHDTLLVGEIIALDEDELVIQASDFVVNINGGREQLRPEIARVVHDGSLQIEFQVGDYVIASLNQAGDVFHWAWGIHRVDSLDLESLTVETMSPETSAMYTDFVNSGGRFSDFFGSPGRVVRRYGGTETVIFEATPPEEIQASLPKEEVTPASTVASEASPISAIADESSSGMGSGIVLLLFIAGTIVLIVGALVFRKFKRTE